ncbi:type II secretion system F family protein, partial [Candidatus Omnitrophota bacterium]
WWIFPILLIVLFIVYKQFKKTNIGEYRIDYMKLRIPLFGQLLHKIAISRFVRALGIIIGGGVPINHALRVSQDVCGNRVIRDAILEAERRIIAGSNLYQPLEDSGLFPSIITQMVATGEESGNLDTMLIGAADQLDQEIDYKVKKITVLLEPILTIFLGGIVMFIALSLYLPIFNLVKVIR